MKKVIYSFLLIILLIITISAIYLFYIKEDKVAILTYHDITDEVPDENSVNISEKTFEKQIKWYKDHGYKSLSLDEFYDWKINNKKIPRKSILIVFDDGWKSFYTKAIPILEKYDMKATVFIIWRYSQLSTDRNDDIYMNISDIEDVKKNYTNMQIESHSYNLHEKDLADSNDYDLYNKDMQYVNSNYYDDLSYYAYPFGRRQDNYIKALKDNNYKLAFTFGPYDFASKKDHNYQIPRMGIFESTKMWKLKLKLFLEM